MKMSEALYWAQTLVDVITTKRTPLEKELYKHLAVGYVKMRAHEVADELRLRFNRAKSALMEEA